MLAEIEENAVNESEQFFSDENIHDEIIEEIERVKERKKIKSLKYRNVTKISLIDA